MEPRDVHKSRRSVTLCAITLFLLGCVAANSECQAIRSGLLDRWQSVEEPRLSWRDQSMRGGAVTRAVRRLQAGQLEHAIYLPVVTRSWPSTHYVSRVGSNDDGRSWATAWNELDQIHWDLIQPGDTILIDGGPVECAFPVMVTAESNTPRGAAGGECGMVYESTLAVGKSGEPGNPITIKLAEEPGRNGTVRIFGGRSAPLPYCGQTHDNWQASGVRPSGILIDRRNWIVIDGVSWSGIMIYGHNRYGIELYKAYRNDTYPVPEHITVRNVEVYDNGWVYQSGEVWHSDGPGVDLTGSHVIFERAIVHDNGQDAFQSGGGLDAFTLSRSWLYNARRHPTRDESFNYCTHSDGIQVYGGGAQSGFWIEESIIGPGFMQGVILGQTLTSNGEQAVVHAATFRNVLFAKASSSNILGYADTKPQGWLIDHVTGHCPSPCELALLSEGSGHTVRDSIFHSGAIYLPDGLASYSGNCQWNTTGFRLGQAADPLFVDVDDSAPFSLDDYALAPDSPCAGRGSSLTSVAQLLGQPALDRVLKRFSWEVEGNHQTLRRLYRDVGA